MAEAAQVDALDADAVEKHARAVAERSGSINVSFNLISLPDHADRSSERGNFHGFGPGQLDYGYVG
jgi:hypothetical protein